MRSLLLIALVLAFGRPLVAQSRAVDFSKPAWTSPVEFTTLFSVRELSDGRIIVPDPSDNEIRLLGTDGRQLGTIGRRGGGPQEFQMALQALALPGDSTLINDREQQRLLLIGPDAKPVRTIPWPTVPLGGDGIRNPMHSDGMGNLYFARSSYQPDQGRTPLLRWNVASGRIDSVQVLEMATVATGEGTADGSKFQWRRVVPFEEGDSWAVSAKGEVAIVHPRAYRMEWRAVDGRIRQGTPIAYTPVPVTAAERTSMHGPAGGDLPIPATKPAVTRAGIIVSPAGEVWVARFKAPGEEGTRWDVLGPDGKLVRSVVLPGRRMILGFGRTNTYVVSTDEDDIQHLEAYR